MSTARTTQRRARKTPRFLHLARTFYGDALDARGPRELFEAMADWAELTEEQTFTIAHLHYLGLIAQARTQSLLVQVRDLLDEVAEGLGEVMDE